MKRILVLGAGGQLGRTLMDISEQEHIPLYGLDHNTCDITNEAQLKQYFYKLQPDIVINCAAWTDVNLAERLDSRQKVYDINATGAGNVAKYCKEIYAKLIHISTDYVFGNNHCRPISEYSEVGPVNLYGLTKLEGEKKVDKNCDNYIIVRTSWLYSKYNNNFVNKIYEQILGYQASYVCVDEVSSPTYCVDLARFLLYICNDEYYCKSVNGIFNFSNFGITSRYDFAYEIARLCGSQDLILPIYNSKETVLRPKYSALDLSRTSKTFNFRLRDWREALLEYHKTRNR